MALFQNTSIGITLSDNGKTNTSPVSEKKEINKQKKHITPHTSSVFSIYLGSVPIAVVSVLSNSLLFFASDPCFGKIYLIWRQLVHSSPLFRSYPVICFLLHAE